MPESFKTCSVCKLLKAKSEFNRNSSRPTSFAYHCKSCQKEYDAQRHQKRRADWRLRVLALASARSAANKYEEKPLSLDDLNDLYVVQQGKCYYTGVQLEVGAKINNPNAPSLDRIDNAKGYCKSNVVLCLKWVNLARNSIPVEEFLENFAIAAKSFLKVRS